MKRVFGIICGFVVMLSLTACTNLMTNDKFIYIGHGATTPMYQLYYDQTRESFVLVDKDYGCLSKDGAGTCFMIPKDEVEAFRENVLAKMIKIDKKLAKDSYGQKTIKSLDKAGISTIKKTINIGDIDVTPVKQVVIDRQQQYTTMNSEYKLSADLIGTIVNTNGNRHIKVFYVLSLPTMSKTLMLQPFIVDPEFLYRNMTMESVSHASEFQGEIKKHNQDMKGQIDDYLGGVINGESDTKK